MVSRNTASTERDSYLKEKDPPRVHIPSNVVSVTWHEAQENELTSCSYYISFAVLSRWILDDEKWQATAGRRNEEETARV